MARSKKFQPTRFMLPTSHYDKDRADHAVNFIQALKHTKGVWAGKPFLLFRFFRRYFQPCGFRTG